MTKIKRNAHDGGDMDATRLYLKQVSRNQLLTHAQEISISQQIENSKRDLLLALFAIPSAVQQFHFTMQAVLRGEVDVNTVIESEDVPATMAQIQEIQNHIAACSNAQQREDLAMELSQLPIRLSFYDQLVAPFTTLVRELMAVQGAYMRFAISKGMTREQWLAQQHSGTQDAKWTKFAFTHAQQVQAFEDQLTSLAAPTGLTVSDLQSRVREIQLLIKAKDQGVDTMLKSNLRLVVSVAKKYANISQTPILDLIQEGNIGLLKAIEKFNWRLGFRFSTYATWWIKQCVLKALNEQHRIIRIPTHMSELAKKVVRAKQDYVDLHGFEPSLEEIACSIDSTVEQVEKVYTVAQGTISLETPVSGEDEDQTLAQLIEDQDSVSVFEQLAVVDTSNAVSDVLKELTPKEERVIRMRFGIGVQEESTLEDIGLKLGVTRERIRQIEAKTLKKLAGNELGQRLREAFH